MLSGENMERAFKVFGFGENPVVLDAIHAIMQQGF
jgi:hypothetical protein